MESTLEEYLENEASVAEEPLQEEDMHILPRNMSRRLSDQESELVVERFLENEDEDEDANAAKEMGGHGELPRRFSSQEYEVVMESYLEDEEKNAGVHDDMDDTWNSAPATPRELGAAIMESTASEEDLGASAAPGGADAPAATAVEMVGQQEERAEEQEVLEEMAVPNMRASRVFMERQEEEEDAEVGREEAGTRPPHVIMERASAEEEERQDEEEDAEVGREEAGTRPPHVIMERAAAGEEEEEEGFFFEQMGAGAPNPSSKAPPPPPPSPLRKGMDGLNFTLTPDFAWPIAKQAPSSLTGGAAWRARELVGDTITETSSTQTSTATETSTETTTATATTVSTTSSQSTLSSTSTATTATTSTTTTTQSTVTATATATTASTSTVTQSTVTATATATTASTSTVTQSTVTATATATTASTSTVTQSTVTATATATTASTSTVTQSTVTATATATTASTSTVTALPASTAVSQTTVTATATATTASTLTVSRTTVSYSTTASSSTTTSWTTGTTTVSTVSSATTVSTTSGSSSTTQSTATSMTTVSTTTASSTQTRTDTSVTSSTWTSSTTASSTTTKTTVSYSTTASSSSTSSSTTTQSTVTRTTTTPTSTQTTISSTSTSSSTTESSTTSQTTETTTTTTTLTSTTATTTTAAAAPPASQPDFTIGMGVQVTLPADASSAEIQSICDGMPAVVSSSTGIPEFQISCSGFTRSRRLEALPPMQGGRQLSQGGLAGSFDMEITAQTEADASVFTSEVVSMNATTIATAIQEEILVQLNFTNFTIEVAGVQNVITARDSQPRVARGSMEISMDSQEYSNEEVSGFLRAAMAQTLINISTGVNETISVEEGNITILIDGSRVNIRFTIQTWLAEDDLAILGEISRSDYRGRLQQRLDEAGAAIGVGFFDADLEIYGQFTIRSNASSPADQMKLTNADMYSIESMQNSIKAMAMATYDLAETEVGVSLLNVFPYVENDGTSNRIEVAYSYVPASFEAYCRIAADQDSDLGHELMEAALSYGGVDPAISPVVEAFDQDPILDCTAGPALPEESLSAAVIALIVIAAVAGVVGSISSVYCVVFRLRDAKSGEGVAVGGSPGVEEGEQHSAAPSDRIQIVVDAPPADEGQGQAVPETAVANEPMPSLEEFEDDEPEAPWHARLAQPLGDFGCEFMDDEPRV